MNASSAMPKNQMLRYGSPWSAGRRARQNTRLAINKARSRAPSTGEGALGGDLRQVHESQASHQGDVEQRRRRGPHRLQGERTTEQPRGDEQDRTQAGIAEPAVDQRVPESGAHRGRTDVESERAAEGRQLRRQGELRGED